MTTSPAHLYFIIARNADLAIIFRRGPTNWTQLISWNLKDDSFTFGQWFHGRIFERRSDLSPSGKYLLYFAGDWRRKRREFGPTWTAISRPPYYTALALWQEMGTWGGGGTFIEDHHVVLSSGDLTLAPGYTLPKKFKIGPREPKRSPWRFEDLAIRTERDYGDLNICHRNAGENRLLINARDKATWKQEYLFIREGDRDILLENCQCLEADHQGRTLIAVAGKLYVLSQNTTFSSIDELNHIADFNENKPAEVPCPEHLAIW